MPTEAICMLSCVTAAHRACDTLGIISAGVKNGMMRELMRGRMELGVDFDRVLHMTAAPAMKTL